MLLADLVCWEKIGGVAAIGPAYLLKVINVKYENILSST